MVRRSQAKTDLMHLKWYLLLSFCFLSISSAVAETETLPASVLALPAESQYFSPYAFVVDKKTRKLTVWKSNGSGLTKVDERPADMGKKEGAKTNRGDFRTPEGIYFLTDRMDQPEIDFKLYGSRAFTLDYPNHFDRIDGRTGDGIWLHAVPDDVPLTRGSRGCVVVRDQAIMDLTQYIKLGRTPIIIEDSLAPLSQAQWSKVGKDITDTIEQWRQAWESKVIDNYMNFYADGFETLGMNRDQWRAHKTKLASIYQTINVNLTRPIVLNHGRRAIVRFLQKYQSDKNADFGEKTLYLVANDGPNRVWKIVAEYWRAENTPEAKQELATSLPITNSAQASSAAHVN